MPVIEIDISPDTTDSLRRERDELRTALLMRDVTTTAALSEFKNALAEACDLAEEGWGYASDYFNDKYDSRGRIAELRSRLVQ